jgi:L-seryl-tRNA(Ser) seleniumtransferase
VAARAQALAALLRKTAPRGLSVAVEATRAPVGGGSLPGFELPSAAVALAGAGGAEAIARALRRAAVPVIGRVCEDRVLLDARTLLPGDESDIEAAVAALRFD